MRRKHRQFQFQQTPAFAVGVGLWSFGQEGCRDTEGVPGYRQGRQDLAEGSRRNIQFRNVPIHQSGLQEERV